MPEVTAPYVPGTPCWVDLVVPDQREALDFYRDLFGWQGEPGPPETGGYAVCSLNGKAVAGIMTAMTQDGGSKPPPAWTTYLAVRDADATVQVISNSGGTVLFEAMDVLALGRMAIAADSTGAVFGLWQANEFHGCEVVNEPGSVVWNELNTPDPDAAGRFYTAALGVTVSPMENAADYFCFKADDRMVGGMQNLDRSAPGSPAHWLTYFSVDDTDSKVDALVRAGGTLIKPPFDMEAGRMAVVQDPQGAVFAVIDATGPEPGQAA